MTQAEMYLELLELTCRADTRDSSYHAAFYLLSADGAVFSSARCYIDSIGVDFSALKHACKSMSEPQRQLIDIAHNLFSWNSDCAATPFDISMLGYPLLDFVCTAFYIANGMMTLSVRDGEMVLDKTRYNRAREFASFFKDLTAQALADADIVI